MMLPHFRPAAWRVPGLIAVLMCAAAASPAAAQAPKKAAPAPAPAAKTAPQTLPVPKQLGSFESWTSVELAQASSKICYVFARPSASDPKAIKRGEVMLTVTHRPAAKRFDEVSFQAGYPYKSGAPVAVEIDGKKFEFFTRTDVDPEAAWAKDDAADKAVVAAMKNGKTLKVRGISARNTQTTDTLNLAGFVKAYAEIGKACAK